MNLQHLSDTDKMMLESLYWWDIPTLFRAPLDRDPANADIALVGVPHSTGNGTTERDQHLGPRALRQVSAMAKRVHVEFNIDPWNAASLIFIAGLMPQALDRFRWAGITPSPAASSRPSPGLTQS